MSAQDFSGLARLDPVQSRIAGDDTGFQIDLALTQAVPYRVFTLTEPMRLLVDFREVDFSGLIAEDLLVDTWLDALYMGPLRPGWSRMVAELPVPQRVVTAGMAVNEQTGQADLTVTTAPTDAESFAANAGAPAGPGWDNLMTADTTLQAVKPRTDGGLTVVIDPGHGGIDPGAQRDGQREADIMLQLGFEVADALNRTGYIRAIMTRDSDIFVPLESRMTIARAAGADLLISLHADALEEDEARGASIYTLSDEGVDRAAARMAERHDRGDLVAGLDLTGQTDQVATVLMDMARIQSRPAADRFAAAVVDGLREAGAQLNSRPRRSARLAVLNAADFPSVLIEAGFLSNSEDLALLSNAEGRVPVVEGIVSAIITWAADEAVRGPLLRQ